MIFTLRVTTGQEKIVSEILRKKAIKEKLEIYSILHVDNIRGYIFIESKDENEAVKLIQKVRHVKGLLKEPIKIEEIKKLIETTEEQKMQIENGDIVEMIAGPFKGEKAKVTKVESSKEEITVELIEVAVPIPVTVKTKMIKLFQKKSDIET
ncbi:transcription elongation factor Spt5 [Candidatus Micrarchaeota archaeon]|nr:transcription elongation factor Spt5 [Candidatus Micrarchaeota archaeon]